MKTVKGANYIYVVGDTIEHSDFPGQFIIQEIKKDTIIVNKIGHNEFIELPHKGIGQMHFPKYVLLKGPSK